LRVIVCGDNKPGRYVPARFIILISSIPSVWNILLSYTLKNYGLPTGRQRGKMTLVQKIFICCAISIIWAFPVNAGVENRPINTDDAYTLDRGVLTASLGAVFTRSETEDEETDITIDLGYGITDRLEVTVDIPIAFTNPKDGSTEEGLSDISIRPEFLLIKEQESLPAISFAATFNLFSLF